MRGDRETPDLPSCQLDSDRDRRLSLLVCRPLKDADCLRPLRRGEHPEVLRPVIVGGRFPELGTRRRKGRKGLHGFVFPLPAPWRGSGTSSTPRRRSSAHRQRCGAAAQGKHKAIYTPHIDTGDHVVIVNGGQGSSTGRKEQHKLYRYHTAMKRAPRRAGPGSSPEKSVRMVEEAVARHAAEDQAR